MHDEINVKLTPAQLEKALQNMFKQNAPNRDVVIRTIVEGMEYGRVTHALGRALMGIPIDIDLQAGDWVQCSSDAGTYVQQQDGSYKYTYFTLGQVKVRQVNKFDQNSEVMVEYTYTDSEGKSFPSGTSVPAHCCTLVHREKQAA